MTITNRIDNITKIDEAHLGVNIPAPKSVKIELTGKCNFRCSFCARVQNLRETGHMDFELFKCLAYDMHESGVEELGLFYLGESFLYPKLAEAIKFAKSIGFPYVFLTTNGSLADGYNVAQCIRSGLDSLKFSLNYSDKEQFEDLARVNSKYFDKMIDNIATAHSVRNAIERETGKHCGLYGSYIMYDGEQRQKMQKILKTVEPYLDEVYELPLYNQASFVQETVNELGYKPTAGNRGRLDNMRDPLPCWACFTEGHITYDGLLSACCFDHDNRFTMADLKQVSFMEGWNSDKFRELRAAHLSKDVSNTVCEDCVIW